MKNKNILTIMAISLGLASCTTQTKPELNLNLNGEWKVITLAGEAVPETLNEPQITFDVANKSFSSNTGVNTLNGSFTQDPEGNISFSDGPMTRMMGDSVSMAVEDNFVKAIAAAKTVTEADGTLSLKDADGKVVMTLKK